MLTLNKRYLIMLAVLAVILLAMLFAVVRFEIWQQVHHVLTVGPDIINHR